MSRRRSKSSTWRWVASLAVLVVLLVGAAFFGKKIIAHLRAHGMLPGAEPDTAAAAAPGTPVRLTGEAALQKLDDLIAKNPENLAALITRGNLYAEEKKWDLAQKDYETAASVDPAKISPKINLAEINFRQKKYDAARPQFAALESNADVGDFASYKVFLCDLFAGHEAAARAELDAFNAVGSNASYYFANIAWSAYHKDEAGAKDFLTSAVHIYSVQKVRYYAQPLLDEGYLPLPPG